MGFFSKLKDTVTSNIGALLEKSDDPIKTVNRALRQARADLAAVNKEIDTVIANEEEAHRKLQECGQEAMKYVTAEKKAEENRNFGDAANLRETKTRLLNKLADLNAYYKDVHEHADEMRALREKLASDVQVLEGRANLIKGKAATAKARERAGRITSSSSGSTTNTLARADAMATRQLDTVKAAEALDHDPEDDLLRKYQ